jgi:hypothetical protein
MTQFYHRLIPDDHRTAIISLKSTARSFVAVLVLLGGTFLLEHFGLELSFLVAAAIGIVSWFLILLVFMMTRRAERAPETIPSATASTQPA